MKLDFTSLKCPNTVPFSKYNVYIIKESHQSMPPSFNLVQLISKRNGKPLHTPHNFFSKDSNTF